MARYFLYPEYFKQATGGRTQKAAPFSILFFQVVTDIPHPFEPPLTDFKIQPSGSIWDCERSAEPSIENDARNIRHKGAKNLLPKWKYRSGKEKKKKFLPRFYPT